MKASIWAKVLLLVFMLALLTWLWFQPEKPDTKELNTLLWWGCIVLFLNILLAE